MLLRLLSTRIKQELEKINHSHFRRNLTHLAHDATSVVFLRRKYLWTIIWYSAIHMYFLMTKDNTFILITVLLHFCSSLPYKFYTKPYQKCLITIHHFENPSAIRSLKIAAWSAAKKYQAVQIQTILGVSNEVGNFFKNIIALGYQQWMIDNLYYHCLYGNPPISAIWIWLKNLLLNNTTASMPFFVEIIFLYQFILGLLAFCGRLKWDWTSDILSRRKNYLFCYFSTSKWIKLTSYDGYKGTKEMIIILFILTN